MDKNNQTPKLDCPYDFTSRCTMGRCDCKPIIENKQDTMDNITKIAMDKLKNKWGHLYTFGYPKLPFPTNYENDLNWVKVGLYEGIKQQPISFTLEQIDELFFPDNGNGYFDEYLNFKIGDGEKFNEITFKDWFEKYKK